MKMFFTKQEAEVEVGKDVRVIKSFLDVPVGSVGRVTRTIFGNAGYLVEVSLQKCNVPIILRKDEYVRFFVKAGILMN